MDLISIGEASRRFDISIHRLRRLEVKGKLRSVRTAGKHRRYDLAELQRVLAGACEDDFASPVAVVSGAALLEHATRKPLQLSENEIMNMLVAPLSTTREGSISIIVGSHGSGKTTTMTQLAASAALDHQINTLMICLETPTAFALQRMIMFRDQMTREAAQEALQSHGDDYDFGSLAITHHDGRHNTFSVEHVEQLLDEAADSFADQEQAKLVFIDSIEMMLDKPKEMPEIVDQLRVMAYRRGVTMIIGCSVPRAIGCGVPISSADLTTYDSDRWGRNTVHCLDSIVSMWRPEYAPGLDQVEVHARRGQVKMATLKSRYGPQMIEHLVMDAHTGSIITPVMFGDFDLSDHDEGMPLDT